ncbi:MAG: hypothetical protein DRP41_00285 [Thermodesulfobacteriota bacterium]|nr:MAG: hypothetical protein DRP41_00285 [Thermodesulfobacteriota bacterium]
MELWIEALVKDKKGKVLKRIKRKAHSFVGNFIRCLAVQFASGREAITDVGGNAVNPYAHSISLKAGAASGNDNFGVQAGTGTNAVSINDNALQSKIAHGTGSGQLQYGGVTFGATACDASKCECTITRDFANGSGGDITVNELGLVLQMHDGGNKNILVARDVVSGGIAVANGQTLTVNYKIRATA